MKIDSVIKEFYEKYDREAIKSIDDISKEYGLVLHEHTIKTFNMNESFETFDKYLKGYSLHKINHVNKEGGKSQEEIRENVKMLVNDKLFQESNTKYADIPAFITGYIEGVNTLTETIDDIKRNMSDAGVNAEEIGEINEFTDMFINKMNESFNTTMDRILWASGYNTKKRLSTNNTNKNKAPIFL